MKGIFKTLAVVLVMALGLSTAVFAGNDSQQNKTLLVPLRFVCEAQGANVAWDDQTGTAIVTANENKLAVKPGSRQAEINNTPVVLDREISLADGRVKVPLSLLNDALQLKLTEDDCLKILALKYVELLSKGSVSDCQMLFDSNLRQTVTAGLIQQLGLSLNSLGELKQVDITVRKNGIHQNVAIRYVSAVMGQLDYIVRFTYGGLIDDVMIKPEASTLPYQAPEYDKKDTYTEKEVVIGQDPWQLPGTLTLPKGEGPFPVVVLVHGSGPNDRDETLGPLKSFRDLAVGLASQNIAVLRYEKRSLEHNLKLALIPKVTVKDETVDDAISAVNFLATVGEIDKSKIFVLGHSQGGLLIPRILKEDGKGAIRGAVIMSANTRPLEDLLVEQYQYLLGLNLATQQQYEAIKIQADLIKSPEFNPENPPKGFTMGTPHWWADLKSYKPAEAVKSETRPLLVMQGERDYQVSAAADFTGWKDALAGKSNATFKLYPKLNHMYTEGEGKLSTPTEYYTPANVPLYVIKDIAQWIAAIR